MNFGFVLLIKSTTYLIILYIKNQPLEDASMAGLLQIGEFFPSALHSFAVRESLFVDRIDWSIYRNDRCSVLSKKHRLLRRNPGHSAKIGILR
jgi:hypothetical protein